MTYSVSLTIIKLRHKVNGLIWLYNAIKDYITLAIFHMATYLSLWTFISYLSIEPL